MTSWNIIVSIHQRAKEWERERGTPGCCCLKKEHEHWGETIALSCFPIKYYCWSQILVPQSNTNDVSHWSLWMSIEKNETSWQAFRKEQREGLQRWMCSLALLAWYVSMSVLEKPCMTSGVEPRNCDRWLAPFVLRESQSLARALLWYSVLSCVIQSLGEWQVNLLGVCCPVAADSSHCQTPSSVIILAVPRWFSHQLLLTKYYFNF